MSDTVPTEELSFDRDGATIRGYGAWPSGAGPFPGLVLIHDVRGLSDHYRDVTRRFAAVCASSPAAVLTMVRRQC